MTEITGRSCALTPPKESANNDSTLSVITLGSSGLGSVTVTVSLPAPPQGIETELSGRSISLQPEDLRDRNIVAIAGGPSKVAGIRAALASGFLKGLITDELTARCLATDENEVGLAQGADFLPPGGLFGAPFHALT